ncbi:hypothetical protein TWF730_003682 [Orbilia blumenaviensis]|uniref:BTB domain-containing protein n=1 Tax=Orbilia blumenaviensis TaxID=1796055 RepID=A0AAV9U6Z1_9PEZI
MLVLIPSSAHPSSYPINLLSPVGERNVHSLFMSETILVHVGPSHARFNVHIDLICRASPYFKELLSVSPKPESICLDGEHFNLDAFESFLEYCYLGKYIGAKPTNSWVLLRHAQVYALGEKLGCGDIKNLAVQEASKWYHDQKNAIDISDFIQSVRVIYDCEYADEFAEVGSVFSITPLELENPAGTYEVIGNRFRAILAYTAAVYLNELKENDEFMRVHYDIPAFNTDMMLFLQDRTSILAGGDYSAAVSQFELVPCKYQKDGLPVLEIKTETLLKFSRRLNGGTILVYVGEKAEEFELHTSVVECSDYFRRLVASEMREGLEGTVKLESEVDTPAAFDKFVQYCYFQEYLCGESWDNSLVQHAGVYVLAERLGCLGLKSLALRKATQACRVSDSTKSKIFISSIPAVAEIIYENTYDDSGGQRLRNPKGNNTQTTTKGSEKTTRPPGAAEAEKRKEPKKVSDDFRVLLALYTSTSISKLRQLAPFLSTHRQFPEFARDIMLLASPANKV